MSNKSQEKIRQSSNISQGDKLLRDVEEELRKVEGRRKELRRTLAKLNALKKSAMPSGVWSPVQNLDGRRANG